METLLTLNSGQHILFGFLMTSLYARSGRDSYTIEETLEIAGLVKELTALELYDNVFETPDVLLMSVPEQAYEIFDEWYDENENYFQKFLVD